MGHDSWPISLISAIHYQWRVCGHKLRCVHHQLDVDLSSAHPKQGGLQLEDPVGDHYGDLGLQRNGNHGVVPVTRQLLRHVIGRQPHVEIADADALVQLVDMPLQLLAVEAGRVLRKQSQSRNLSHTTSVSHSQTHTLNVGNLCLPDHLNSGSLNNETRQHYHASLFPIPPVHDSMEGARTNACIARAVLAIPMRHIWSVHVQGI